MEGDTPVEQFDVTDIDAESTGILIGNVADYEGFRDFVFVEPLAMCVESVDLEALSSFHTNVSKAKFSATMVTLRLENLP